MGTRGLIGFTIKGRRRATYNHFDSYPEGLGCDVIRFILSLDEDGIKKMQHLVENLIWLDPDCDIEQIDHATARALYGIEPDSEYSPPFTHAPAHKALVEDSHNRDLLPRILAGQRIVIDRTGFGEDRLFCEFAYYVDFEQRVLDVEGMEEDTVRIPFAALSEDFFDEYAGDPTGTQARMRLMMVSTS